jgi:sec-independent protein translocase protein TatA
MFEGLFQPMHLLIILVIVLVVFGPGKLPEVGAALGKSIREFKRGAVEAAREAPSSDRPTDGDEHRP